MLTQLRCHLNKPEVWDKVLLAGLSLFAFAFFVPNITALERIGLVVACSVSLFNGRWRACVPFLRHPILLCVFAFIFWLALSSFWSLDPRQTFTSVRNVFKDYFLVIPPLFYQLSTPAGRAQFFKMLAYAGVVIIAINTWQYIQEYLHNPELLMNFKLHRGWSHPLLFFMPFIMMQTRVEQSRMRQFWFMALAVTILMLVGTGARAVWLGMVAVLLIGFAGDFTWKRAGILILSLAVIGTLSYATIPFVRQKVDQGFDTSGRIGGPWTSATEMFLERPLLGHGFSKEVYNIEFKRRVEQEPGWIEKQPIGPHSNYLEIAYAGGVVGLGLLLALYFTVIICAWKRLRTHGLDEESLYGIVGLAAFVGFYVIRGGFESVRWGPMIIAIVIICHFCGSKSVTAQKPEQIGSGHQ